MTARLGLFALAAVGLAACESPSPASPTVAPFDALAWLAAAERVGFDADTSGYDSPSTVRSKQLTDSLGAEVDWQRACDTYYNPETERLVYEPVPPDGASWVRGTVQPYRLSPTSGLAAIFCHFGAYQGYAALVRLDADGAVLLRAPALDLDGQPLPISTTTFTTPRVGPGDTVTSVAFDRGIGDCGTLVTYRPVGRDSLAVETVRQRACDATPEALEPDAWPIVFAADATTAGQ